MEDYPGSQAQGSCLYSDSADWEALAGPVDVKMCRPSFIPAHIEMARKGKSSEKLAAARVFTILTAEGEGRALDVHKSRTDIAAANGHEALIDLLKVEQTAQIDETLALAKEAATAALANLAAQDDSRKLLVASAVIPALVALVSGQSGSTDLSDELLMYACGALGNLARESGDNQDAIAAAGGIPALIAIARSVGIREEEEDQKEDEVTAPSHATHRVRPPAALWSHCVADPCVPHHRPLLTACALLIWQDPEDDNGLELNASIALRKLAIGNAANYAAMQAELTPSELRYFLHGEIPEDGLVPEAELASR
jgi:hypothetical protein